MGKNVEWGIAILTVVLKHEVYLYADRITTLEKIVRIPYEAHDELFNANFVKTKVRFETVYIFL